MTNFEYIKTLNENELAQILLKYDYDNIINEFDKKFCKNCERFDNVNINGGTYDNCAYCELHTNCKFVDDNIISQEEFANPILWWLKQEKVN